MLAALGYTLNITVLLGIVIVLGMLVDVSVVMVEAVYYRLQRGEKSMESAVRALHEVGIPLTASVLTTICCLPAADAAAGHRWQVHVRGAVRGDGRGC